MQELGVALASFFWGQLNEDHQGRNPQTLTRGMELPRCPLIGPQAFLRQSTPRLHYERKPDLVPHDQQLNALITMSS